MPKELKLWPANRGGISVRTLLSLATAAPLLPFLLLAGIGISIWLGSQKDEELGRVSRTGENLGRALDRELRSYIQAAEIVAGSQYLRDGDIARIRAIARDTARRLGGHFVLMDRSGRDLINTQLEPPAQLGRTQNSRPLDAALSSERTLVHDLVIDTATQHWQFGILVPVRVKGEARYVLAYVPPVRAVQQVVHDLVIPDRWNAALLDGHGRIVARARSYEEFFGKLAGTEFLARLSGRSGLIESIDLQGRPAYTAYQRSSLSGWTAMVWAPTRP